MLSSVRKNPFALSAAVLSLTFLTLGISRNQLRAVRAAGAQSKVPPAQTQAGMNQTAGKIFEKADKEMNLAYKKLLAALDPKSQEKLRNSQRQWLKWRDAETEFLSMKFEGGSAWPMVYSGNKTSLTQQRTKGLNETYKNFRSAGMM